MELKCQKFTVGCCWDGNNNYYSIDYINKLYNSVKRHSTISLDFVLYIGPDASNSGLLDKLIVGVKVFQTGLKYWWSGMMFWMKNPPLVETETLLYMDLDQVIVGNIDDLVNYPSDHCYMKDYPASMCPKGKENDGNATVSLIRNGVGHAVWEEYDSKGRPEWNPLNPPHHRLFPLAAQGIMNSSKIPHDVFPEEWIPSYKWNVIKNGLHKDCKTVSFHGRPKPHECEAQWIKDNWK
jgi:hypothetical protein